MAPLALQQRCNRALENHLAAALAALGTKIDDPVGGRDHIEVVLDHNDRVSLGKKLLERIEQSGDVVEMQPGGRLVEQEKARPLTGAATGPAAGTGEMGGKFEPLRLTAG